MGFDGVVIFAAYVMDLVFGDPEWRFHPVRIIGRLIAHLEKKLNVNAMNRRFAGIVLVILVVGLTISSIWIILKLARLIHPVLYYIASALLVYFSISIKSLAAEALKVRASLEAGEIERGRKDLSMIVARDTAALDESQIIRATLETVAEGTMDGIIAPLFYAFLGGPILAWAYKAINTLDSMVGYRDERFKEFGSFAAQIDGLANYIPSKMTPFIISIASMFFGKDWRRSLRWASRYLLRGPQSNGPAAEASLAGALGVRLGGLNYYDAVPVEKTPIGDDLHPLKMGAIGDSIAIAYASSGIFMLLGASAIWIIGMMGGR